MSETNPPAKKAARKRVVKRGVRDARAGQREAASLSDEAPAQVQEEKEVKEEAADQDFTPEENEVTYALFDSGPAGAEKSEAKQGEIAFFEEDSVEKRPAKKSSRKRKRAPRSDEKERAESESAREEEGVARSSEDEPREEAPVAFEGESERDDRAEEKRDDQSDDRREGNQRGRNRREGRGRERERDREESAPRTSKVDREEAAEKAWEIYQGELEEEGVSLVDPRRAREVARRCLELATVFCEERDRFLGR